MPRGVKHSYLLMAALSVAVLAAISGLLADMTRRNVAWTIQRIRPPAALVAYPNGLSQQEETIDKPGTGHESIGPSPPHSRGTVTQTQTDSLESVFCLLEGSPSLRRQLGGAPVSLFTKNPEDWTAEEVVAIRAAVADCDDLFRACEKLASSDRKARACSMGRDTRDMSEFFDLVRNTGTALLAKGLLSAYYDGAYKDGVKDIAVLVPMVQAEEECRRCFLCPAVFYRQSCSRSCPVVGRA